MHSYWPREGRRTPSSTGRVASFFASFFPIDSWKAFVPFLCIFGSPWGSQKSPKIAKSRCREVSFFRAHDFLALLADCQSIWVLSGHAFLALLIDFGSFWLLSRGKKVAFFHGTGDEICILAKNELSQSQNRF